MTITLLTVQEIAPDKASLMAAKKLLSQNKWTDRHFSKEKALIWGNCQGSGSGCYDIVVDIDSLQYRCTCPSRKFPCKHVLALIWLYADNAHNFSIADAPVWVNEWLIKNEVKKKKSPDKATEMTEEEISPEITAQKQADKIKRAKRTRLATNTAISAGLKEYQQWLNDQLRTGLIHFLDHASERCRKMSARLVDAKAINLAARLDELPAKLMIIPKENQLRVLTNELGKMICLIQGWQKNPDNIDVRRAIINTENKESVFNAPNRLAQQGIWQVVAKQIENRRDGLISDATWLRYLGQLSDDGASFMQATDRQKKIIPAIPFALLQDYYPASSLERRPCIVNVGHYLSANIVYYPSDYPIRGIIEHQQLLNSEQSEVIASLIEDNFSLVFNEYQNLSHLPSTLFSFYQAYQQALARIPWLECMPCLLPNGRIFPMNTDKKKMKIFWWQAQSNLQEDNQYQWQLPLQPNQYDNHHNLDIMLSFPFINSFILWDGVYATLGSAYHHQWGKIL